MRLTRKKRLEIYKVAHKWFLIEDNRYIGLCNIILEILIVIYFVDYFTAEELVYSGNLKNFPELNKRKPKKTYNKLYWFKEYRRLPRIKILEEAIKELEAKNVTPR